MKMVNIRNGYALQCSCDECGKKFKENDMVIWIGGHDYMFCLDCVRETLKQAELLIGGSSASKDIENFNKSTIKNITEQDSDFLSLNRKIGL